MQPESARPAGSKKMRWGGYVVSALVISGLLFSGVMKLMAPEDVTNEFTRLGYVDSHAFGIGILEIVCTIIYAIPQTAVVGAVLLTGYLGGATATHVRVGDPYFGPVIGGVLVWLGLYLRDARVRELLPLRRLRE